MVRFSMKCFVKRYQPEKLELFEKNLDIAPHPEDAFCNTGTKNSRGIGQQVFPDPDFVISEYVFLSRMFVNIFVSKSFQESVNFI